MGKASSANVVKPKSFFDQTELCLVHCFISQIMAVDLDLVRPTTPCSPQIIPLTPLDQVAFRLYVTFVHCFSLPPRTDHKGLYLRLKYGLSETISELPFLGGCIIPEVGKSGRVQIQINEGYGIRFPYRDYTDALSQTSWRRSYDELKAAHFPISALDAGKLSPVEFVPTSPTPPVMVVQANFIDGGLLLTTSIHHSASDATGFATVLKIWAKHSRSDCETGGILSLTTPNWRAMDRSVLMKGHAEAHIRDSPELRVRDSLELTVLQRTGVISACPARENGIFYFSPSRLAQLKLAASSDKPTDPWISTNDALCALLGRHISRARGLGPLESGGQGTLPVQFTLAVQGRRRLAPPLPEEFLGNVVILCPATLDINTLTSPTSPLYDAASTLRKALNSIDSGYLRGRIGMIDSIPDLNNLEVAVFDNPQRDLLVSSWSDLGLLQVDWGQGIGRPEYIRIPQQPSTGGMGGAGIFPRLLDGGLEVLIGVEVETMRRLRADEEFLKFAEWRCT